METKKCRKCNGTGLDFKLHHRYTTKGSRDERSCEECFGAGEICLKIEDGVTNIEEDMPRSSTG